MGGGGGGEFGLMVIEVYVVLWKFGGRVVGGKSEACRSTYISYHNINLLVVFLYIIFIFH